MAQQRLIRSFFTQFALVAVAICHWALWAEPAALVSQPLTGFVVSYQNLPEQAQRDFHYAAKTWSQCLQINVPVKVAVSGITRGPTGFAYSNMVRNKPYLPVKNVWYPSALANQLAQKRVASLESEQVDIHIFLSLKTNWYFQQKDKIAADQTDFINVAVHEIAHGLGVASSAFIPWQGEPVASLGKPNEYVNFFSYAFPLHEQDGTLFLFDSLVAVKDSETSNTKTLNDYPNPSLALANALRHESIHFTGQQTRSANQGRPLRLVPGNISHFSGEAAGNVNEKIEPTPIMHPSSGMGESVHQPDRLLLAILQDLGWEIKPDCL